MTSCWMTIESQGDPGCSRKELIAQSRSGTKAKASGSRARSLPFVSFSVLAGLLFFTSHVPAASSNSVVRSLEPEPAPVATRDIFNAGTRKLREGKLREAEAFFQSALNRQEEAIQPQALYNLGHARFAQGEQELKKSLSLGPLTARGRRAAENAGRAIQQ